MVRITDPSSQNLKNLNFFDKNIGQNPCFFKNILAYYKKKLRIIILFMNYIFKNLTLLHAKCFRTKSKNIQNILESLHASNRIIKNLFL